MAFDLEPGGCLLVVGPSGSGKSTLALAVAGLVPHDVPGSLTGFLEVSGVDASLGRRAAGAPVGLVFQDPDRQLVMERVEDDVAFGLENLRWPTDAMRARVPQALGEHGLSGLDRRRPNRLSGGEQQRLALAGVLAPWPGMLVLDEPTANLDPGAASVLLERLTRLRDRRSTTIVLVEHRAPAAWAMADVVLALGSDGRPVDVGPPNLVLARSGKALAAAGIWLPTDRAGAGRQRVPAGDSGMPTTAGLRRSTAALPEMPIAEAYDAWFGYDRGRPVLEDVDLAVRAGERLALVGPNGSGKSTLGRLLVGLLRPDRGTLRLAGRDPWRLDPASLARLAGYVFQDPERQFLAATVAAEVRLGLRGEELRRVDDLMDRLGLPLGRFGPRSPYRLSGGEQRRLSLACVLVRRPALLVLDEPTFGQDRRGYEALLAILQERLETGTAVVAATHDEHLVADLADRRVELAAGRITSDVSLP